MLVTCYFQAQTEWSKYELSTYIVGKVSLSPFECEYSGSVYYYGNSYSGSGDCYDLLESTSEIKASGALEAILVVFTFIGAIFLVSAACCSRQPQSRSPCVVVTGGVFCVVGGM